MDFDSFTKLQNRMIGSYELEEGRTLIIFYCEVEETGEAWDEFAHKIASFNSLPVILLVGPCKEGQRKILESFLAGLELPVEADRAELEERVAASFGGGAEVLPVRMSGRPALPH